MTQILNELFSSALPILLQAISAVLGLLLIRMTGTVKRRFGIEVEARHREALHAALMSGIRAALLRGQSGDNAIETALRHATESVPDAIEALAPAGGVLEEIARGKLREVIDGMGALQLDMNGQLK